MAKQVIVEVPDSLDLDARDVRMILAAHLYEQGRLALGHAADLAGLTKRVFMEKLGEFGVSVFNHPASDIEADMRNA